MRGLSCKGRPVGKWGVLQWHEMEDLMISDSATRCWFYPSITTPSAWQLLETGNQMTTSVYAYVHTGTVHSYIYAYLSSYTHSFLALFLTVLKDEPWGFKPQGAPNMFFIISTF